MRKVFMGFMALSVLLLPALAVQAQEELFEWLDQARIPYYVKMNYDMQYDFDENLEGQPGDFGMSQHDLDLSVPFFKFEKNYFGLFSTNRMLDIDTRAILPDTGRAFPENLYDANVGVSYLHIFDNDWIGGALASYGSASDEPFNSFDETEIKSTAFLRVPHVDNNYWVFLLNYSNNREFLNNIPIPGVGYWYEPSDRLLILAGIPFAAVKAEPVDRWHLNLLYLPIRTVKAEVSYDVAEPVKLFGGFSWDNHRYFLEGRADDDDRLFYYEKKVAGGVRVRVSKNVGFEVEGGYKFDRFFFEGEDFDDRSFNRVNIEDGPFVGANVNVRF